MIDFIYRWQTLVGAFIGAMVPFFLWWFADYRTKKRKYYDNLYFLERLLVDQINNIIDTKRTINSFINDKLNKLIETIKERGENQTSIDHAFFPLFSVIPFDKEIYQINTKSGYIDNKIAISFQLSQNIPFMIKDLREQFYFTVNLNKELALKQVNSPSAQKKSYIENIELYKQMVEENIFQTNFPIYLKVLTETWEAVKELQKIKLWRWLLKFNPKYKFFCGKQAYVEAKENVFNDIEKYFQDRVNFTLLKYKDME